MDGKLNCEKSSNIVAKSSSWEKLFVCVRHRKKSEEEKEEKIILSDFTLLNFAEKIFTDIEDKINYNDGKIANPFDKIAKYYGRNKNVFHFISLLRNQEFMDSIFNIISEKCNFNGKEEFTKRLNLYLRRIELAEVDAKEFLESDKFPGAFFNGYHCGDRANIHENLNINFNNFSQYLETTNIFNRKITRMEEMKSELKTIKIYDNGIQAVTLTQDHGQKINFQFQPESSCQLVINRVFEEDSYTLFIDISSSEIAYVELQINDIEAKLEKFLQLSINNEVIQINRKNIYHVLKNYLDREAQMKYNHLIPDDECLPIKTLEALKNWNPTSVKHFNEKLRKRKEIANHPKTLICHDMKGGYLEERFVNGMESEDNYFFVHWAVVDIFVYFSHHLVTIPPCSWISAAHRNGVKVLGTFITEWEDGAKVCEELLTNEKFTYQICMQLVDIAVHYNFDGWLINIENPIKACHIPVLRRFVNYLSERMHSFCPGSQVIWYDSVIKNGQLQWQNALNDLNRFFFLGCDGIFLNYNWEEEHLKESLLTAGSRITDIYVGIDVFGRGCLGGGGFNTNIAVTEARKFGLSIAIFAPGWVHECLDVKEFQENQFKFWGTLQEFTPSRVTEDLPYRSSFCPGFGKCIFREGKIVSNKPWFNLSLQQPQPIYKVSHNATKSSISLYMKDAFNGGGCLLLTGVNQDAANELNFKILETFFQLESLCIVSFTFKLLSKSTEVMLCLNVQCEQKTFDLHLVDDNYQSSKNSLKYLMLPASQAELLRIGYKSRENVIQEQNWINRVYILNSSNHNYNIIKEISVKQISSDSQNDDHTSVLLGELEILPVTPSYKFRYKDLICNCDAKDSQIINLQCIILWEFDSSIFCSDLYLKSVNGERQHICTTFQFSYKLKLNVKKVPEIQILLCPQSVENKQLPFASLKIPLMD